MKNKKYSEKLQNEFAPVLKFFGVKESGNLFKDITVLGDAIETSKLEDKLAKYFFEFYDKDNNGHIDVHELSVLIQDIGEAMGDPEMQNLSENEIQSAFEMLDEDGNGLIEWKEFKKWFDDLMSDDAPEDQLGEEQEQPQQAN